MADSAPFTSNVETETAQVDRLNDRKTPVMPSLDMKNMSSPTALSGCIGYDVALVNGDQWQQLTGDRTHNMSGSWTTNIDIDESWTINNNLTYTVVGNTVDNRIGQHHQTNTNPRFDHFIHTRTETHDQAQVIHQPTQDTHTIATLLQWNLEKHAITAFYFILNGIKIEVDAFEGTEKVVVIENKNFRWQNTPAKLDLGGYKTQIIAFTTEVVPVKLYAAASHLKAVAVNIAAGIRAALSAPWGS